MKLSSFGAAALLGSMAVASVGNVNADTIVNISAQNGGSGVTCCFTDPFNPVTLSVGPGDYAITDAWGDPSALYDAWNTTLGAPAPWNWEWKVFSL